AGAILASAALAAALTPRSAAAQWAYDYGYTGPAYSYSPHSYPGYGAYPNYGYQYYGGGDWGSNRHWRDRNWRGEEWRHGYRRQAGQGRAWSDGFSGSSGGP